MTVLSLDNLGAQLAANPTAVFGDDPKKEYRRLLRLLHPDTRATDIDAGKADALFRRVEDAWARFNGKNLKPAEWTIASKRHSYTVGELVRRTDVVNVYAVRWPDEGAMKSGELRLPRSAKNNDLVEAEVRALKAIASDGDPQLAGFVPKLVDSFRHRDSASGVTRRAVVVDGIPDGFISLAEVHHRWGDLDPKDVAWIFRRLLLALHHGHSVGIVYGAALPDHILIHPEMHGLILPDWTYSTAIGSTAKVMAESARVVPGELVEKKPVTPATDIYSAAITAEFLMGVNLRSDTRSGRALRAFIFGCTLSQRQRPQDALGLLAEYDWLIQDLWGRRQFRPFPPEPSTIKGS